VFEERRGPVSAKEGTVSKRLSVDELFKGRHFDGRIVALIKAIVSAKLSCRVAGEQEEAAKVTRPTFVAL